jgi:hypothetical protein
MSRFADSESLNENDLFGDAADGEISAAHRPKAICVKL